MVARSTLWTNQQCHQLASYGQLWAENMQRNRSNREIERTSQVHLINRVTKSHSGRYRCTVTDHTGTQRYNREVLVTVEEDEERPVLSVDPFDGQVYAQNPVNLTCQLPGLPGWTLFWYKDRQDSTPVQVRDCAGGESSAVYRLWRTSLSHTGQYWCRAGRGSPVHYTEYSEPVYLSVIELFTSVTLLARPSRVVKEGGALNLTCEAVISDPHHGHNDWLPMIVKFSFLRNGRLVAKETEASVYSIARTQSSHAGSYSCVARVGRVRERSPETIISLDNLTLTLVLSLGAVLLLPVAPLVFLLRRYGTRLCRLRRRRQEVMQGVESDAAARIRS